ITASLAKRGNLLFSIEFYYNAGDPEFSELLKIPAAKYSYISKSNLLRGSEVQIDWLEWLLIYGSQPQVQAQIVFNVPKFSRTGDAIMLATPGRWGWGVHPTYAGTPDDNFLTRSLSISRDWLIVELEKQAKARYG